MDRRKCKGEVTGRCHGVVMRQVVILVMVLMLRGGSGPDGGEVDRWW